MILSDQSLRLLERMALVVKRTGRRHFAGNKASVFPGSGLEFHEYSPYQPGDDYRHVDWNAYARLNQLFLKTFRTEHDAGIFFLLDASGSMAHYPAKYLLARQLAAALGYLSLIQWDQVSAAFFAGDLLQELPPGRGRPQIQRFWKFLEREAQGGVTDLNRVLRTFAHKHRRPGFLIVLSDFLDSSDLMGRLRFLAGRGWQVQLLQVLAAPERDPVGDEDVMLVDAETGEQLLIRGNTARALYRDSFRSMQENLLSLEHVGVSFASVQAENSLQQVLLGTLLSQGVIH